MKIAAYFSLAVAAVLGIWASAWGRTGYYSDQAGALLGLWLLAGLAALIGILFLKRVERDSLPTVHSAAVQLPPSPQMQAPAAPVDAERSMAADPGVEQALLGDLAYRREDLRAIIAANPAAYADLLVWLGALGDPAIDAAIAARTIGGSEDGMVAQAPPLDQSPASGPGALAGIALAEQAADPTTSQESLAQLAYAHPELRAIIAANTSAYAGLREWIAAASGTTVAPP